MDERKQKEAASKGGCVAHEKGRAHEFTPEEAREAGRKGGEIFPRIGHRNLTEKRAEPHRYSALLEKLRPTDRFFAPLVPISDRFSERAPRVEQIDKEGADTQ